MQFVIEKSGFRHARHSDSNQASHMLSIMHTTVIGIVASKEAIWSRIGCAPSRQA